uniref:Uncharacterized protein n=1 Tax=Angiostrongylus cantonensis TaxID=6313 RepID=A0A0K0D9F6_ANGCA
MTGPRLNLTKTMFMKNGLVSFAPFTLNGTNISECSSYVYLGREINMVNDLAPELSRRKRSAWEAFKSIKDLTEENKERPTPCQPFRLNGSSCPNVRLDDEKHLEKRFELRLPSLRLQPASTVHRPGRYPVVVAVRTKSISIFREFHSAQFVWMRRLRRTTSQEEEATAVDTPPKLSQPP